MTRGGQLVAGPGEFIGNTSTRAVPAITGFRLTHTRFRRGSQQTVTTARTQRTTTASRKSTTPRGSAFAYRLSLPAAASIVINRTWAGKLIGGRCVRRTGRNAHGHACTIKKRLGKLTRSSRTGTNHVAFSGRIGKTPLAAGTYLAVITARIGNGRHSAPRTAPFTIIAD